MKFNDWRDYWKTHEAISRIGQRIIMGQDDYYTLDYNTRKEYFDLHYVIGDFERLPVFNKYKSEAYGVSISAKRELPKAYLRGLLDIFKFCKFCAMHGLVFDEDGLPF